MRTHRFATLLFDLLTCEEASYRANAFKIQLLGDRVLETVQWAYNSSEFNSLNIDVVGARAGAVATWFKAYFERTIQ